MHEQVHLRGKDLFDCSSKLITSWTSTNELKCIQPWKLVNKMEMDITFQYALINID